MSKPGSTNLPENSVLNAASLDELARNVIPDLMQIIGAEGGSILVRDQDVLVVQSSFGLKKSRADRAQVPLGVGVTGQAAESGTLQWIPDVEKIENHIEGVPDSRWELAIPVSHPQRDTAVVVDFESSTPQRPSKQQRQQVLGELETLKSPLLNRAEKEQLKRSYRKDSISSLNSDEYFLERLESWFENNPKTPGLLVVLQMEPQLNNPDVNSFRDLRGEMKSLGSQLRTIVKGDIFSARLYGNIFAVFIPEVPAGDETTTRESIGSELNEVCTVKQINSSHHPPGAEDPNVLVNNAFVELDFSQDNQSTGDTLKLNQILREGDIRLVKQPIVHSGAEKPLGFEILVRGPEDSKLESPNRLFEAAYQQDRVVELDTLIVRKALEDSSLDSDQMLFLNVERQSIVDNEWKLELVELMDRAGNDCRICVEITEHGDLTNLKPHLDQIRKTLGSTIQFAVDDFGTGTSNFKAIIDLHPDIIKVDRSLIRNIDGEFEKRSFMESILNFTGSNHTRVLAEGIESSSEWETLRNLGVKLAQGYYFAHPEVL